VKTEGRTGSSYVCSKVGLIVGGKGTAQDYKKQQDVEGVVAEDEDNQDVEERLGEVGCKSV